MILLTGKEHESYLNQTNCHIFKKKFGDEYTANKYRKVRDHCHYTGKYRGAAHNIYSLKYNINKKIPVDFCNRLNYDDHFIIKELAKEFEREFNCLGENTQKYKTFSVPITKGVTRINKNRKEITKAISCELQFIDSIRFVASSLSNLVDNFDEVIYLIKCINIGMIMNNVKHVESNTKIVIPVLKTQN